MALLLVDLVDGGGSVVGCNAVETGIGYGVEGIDFVESVVGVAALYWTGVLKYRWLLQKLILLIWRLVLV